MTNWWFVFAIHSGSSGDILASVAGLVSVVVCNYNYGRYLRQSIDSILCQSYSNLQIIIVDDGSTDSSDLVLRKIVDQRVEIIYQKNQGQAAALNTGFSRCIGDFVAFLDSDDFWYPNKLEYVLPAFDDGDVSLVQHNLDVVDENSAQTGEQHPGFTPGQLSIFTSYFKDNHTGFFCPTSGIVCRRSDLNKIFPLPIEWRVCADVALTRPLPIFGNLVTLKEVLGAYRMHNKNMWMNSQGQKKWVNNHQNYVDYANSWLRRSGYDRQLDFNKSKQFLVYKKMQDHQSRFHVRARNLISSTMKKIPGIQALLNIAKRLF